jgi:hypothetical protein
MLSDGKQKIQVIEDHLAECARLDAADRPAKKARGGVSVKTLADPRSCRCCTPSASRTSRPCAPS